MFPRIQRACPYKNELSEIMDGDVCRVCTRKVHDLNAFSEAERAAFLSSCSGEICVSYSLRPVIAAAVTAAALALPAAAQEMTFDEEILVGGIDTAQIEYVADPNAPATPDMPVIYEDDASARTDAGASATDAGADLGHGVETEQAR